MKRETTAKKKLTGTARADREKVVVLNPGKKVSVKCPDALTEAERVIFYDLVDHLVASGTFQPVDAYILEIAAKIIDITRTAAKEANNADPTQDSKTVVKKVSAELTALEKAFSMFMRVSAEIGLGPKSRGLIGVEPTKAEEGDPILELLKKHG